MGGKKPNHRDGDSMAACPFCGHEHDGCDYWEHDAEFRECDACGRPFEWTRYTAPEYATVPAADCHVCERQVAVNRKGLLPRHWRYGTTEDCPGAGQPAVYPERKEEKE